MAAQKGDKAKEILFDEIIDDIVENNKSMTSAIKGKLSKSIFYDMISKDKEKANRYARACEVRADSLFDEIISISDNVGDDLVILPDGREVVDNAVIARDRLRADSRKWAASKMNPKKYGDKLDQTIDVKGGIKVLKGISFNKGDRKQ